MNYLQKKKLAFMSIVNRVKGFIRTITGVLPLTLEGCIDEESIIDYTLYGQSVQNGTPTPEMPVEVESVGEKTANLINWDLLLSSANNNPIEKVENGYYGTRYANSYYRDEPLVKHIKSILKPNVTYTLSRIYNGTRNQANGTIYIQDSASTNIIHCRYGAGLVKTTFTLTQEQIDSIDALHIYFHVSGGTISELQLTESDTVLPYEPYGYKIPITVSGKNLFDINSVENSTYVSVTDGVINHKYGMYAQSRSIPCNVKTLSTGAYTLSCEVSDSVNSSVYIGVRVNDKNKAIYHSYKKPNWIRISYTFTLEEDSTINGIILQADGNSTNFTNLTVLFRNIQLEKVDMPTVYEPYHEPITTNIYLDEPLRKVGDYADYIDFENGKVVRNIVYERIDTVTTKSSAGLVFLSPISQKPMITGTGGDTRVGYAMSDKFARNTDSYGRLANKANHPDVYGALIQTYITSSKAPRVAYIFGDTTITTLELAQEAIGDGFDVIYAVETPTETPITLPKIPTFRGTSILNADTTTQPSNAEITYYSTLKR